MKLKKPWRDFREKPMPPNLFTMHPYTKTLARDPEAGMKKFERSVFGCEMTGEWLPFPDSLTIKVENDIYGCLMADILACMLDTKYNRVFHDKHEKRLRVSSKEKCIYVFKETVPI